MKKLIIIYSFFLLLIIPQKNLGQQAGESDYALTKLTNGIPQSLVGNGYFYSFVNISYALIYKTGNDSLYFIRKQVNTDSINYILILTSNSKIVNYDYLNFREINKDSLFAVSTINVDSDSLFEFYFMPNDNMISFRKREQRNEIPINIELGIGDEFAVMFANYYNYYSSESSNYIETSLPLNLYLSFGVSYLELYKIYFKLGILYLYEDYGGLDKGIFIESKLFKSNFYGVLGVDFLSNSGEGHGVTVYSESGGNVNSICFGLGYSTSRHFNIEIMCYLPLNKVYGYNYEVYDHNGNNTGKHYDKINNGIIKLGFRYLFIL